MNIFEENNLKVDLSQAKTAKRVKDEYYPSPGWKDVDFVFTDSNITYYLELKDPDDQNAVSHPNRITFINDLKSGKLDPELSYKFRDTFVNEFLSGNPKSGKIIYCVLIASNSLTTVELQTRQNILRRYLPAQRPAHTKWIDYLADDCLVFNLSTWKRHFPNFPISRKNQII